jgi:hypothetical protein
MTPYAMITLVAVAFVMIAGLSLLIFGLIRYAASAGQSFYSIYPPATVQDEGDDDSGMQFAREIDAPGFPLRDLDELNFPDDFSRER